MLNKWKYFKATYLSLLFLVGMPIALSAQTYHIVTTDVVEVGENSEQVRNQIAQLYLKERSSWSNNVPAVPFSRKASDPENSVFEKYILMKNAGEVTAHWARLKQLRGETPPKEVRSIRTLYRLLLKYDGGFGIVEEADLLKMPPELKSIYSFSVE
jgi:hypothetical protein